MHPQGYSNVTGFTECGVLGRVVSLAEVINAVTKRGFEGVNVGSTKERVHLQVSDDNVRGSRWIVRYYSDVPACLMAGLSQFSDCVAFHWDVGAGHLDQCRGNS